MIDLQCNSPSSFFRLGGIVVIRHFTVASAELISNPDSLVNMLNTENAGSGNVIASISMYMY